MVNAGLITPVQLDLAKREEQHHGGNLIQIVAQLGFVTPETLADFVAMQAGTRSVNLNRVTIDQSILAQIPQEVSRRCMAMPISRQEDMLTVAMADPFDVNAVRSEEHTSELQSLV